MRGELQGKSQSLSFSNLGVGKLRKWGGVGLFYLGEHFQVRQLPERKLSS